MRSPRLITTSVALGLILALAGCGADGSAAGHCRPCESWQSCDPTGRCVCDDARCNAHWADTSDRYECTSAQGSCVEVECGDIVTCEGSAEVCDPRVNACYPSNGACATITDCPQFGIRDTARGDVECEEGFCRARPLLEAIRLPETAAVPLLRVSDPSPGAVLDAAADMALSWEPGEAAGDIVLILEGLPERIEDALDHAIWGVVRSGTQAPSATWAEGVAIVEGQWQDAPPSAPPTGGPYYLLVQSVEKGQLLGLSDLVPFAIGQDAWPGDRAACADQGVVAGECFHPTRLMTCRGGQCRTICASNADCSATSACGPVTEGLRLCD